MAEPLQEATGRLTSAGSALVDRVRARPYPVLGLAVMAGYVAGGGLFSSMTRPLARAALGALLVPGVRERLRGLQEEFRSAGAGEPGHA
jgi:hypothetical protein